MLDHRELPEALQDLPDPPDDHDFSERGFAIAFCVFLSALAIGAGVLANWMGML